MGSGREKREGGGGRRWVYGVMTALAVGVMGRSFYVADEVHWHRGREGWIGASRAGFLRVDWVRSGDVPREDGSGWRTMREAGGMFSEWWRETAWWRGDSYPGGFDDELLGFRVATSRTDRGAMVEIQVPTWAIVGCFAAGIVRGMRWRKGFESGARVCAGCGYDTRGNVGRCSECGLEVGSH